MTAAPTDDSFDPLEPTETLDAREYLSVLNHDKWRILAVAVGLALVLGLIATVVLHDNYRSTASLALDPVALAELLDTTGEPRDPEQDLAVEVSLVDANEQLAAIDEALGFSYTLTARPTEGSTASIDFEASAGSAAQSREALTAYMGEYISSRTAQGAALVDQQVAPIQASIDELEANRADASAPLDNINAQLADNPTPAEQADLLAQQANLQNQLAGALSDFDDQIAASQSQIQRLQAVREDIEGETHQSITHGPTTAQTTPGGARLAFIGLVLGLVIGTIVSVGRRALDKSVRTKSQLEHITGQRVIGLVPRIIDWSDDSDDVLNVALQHPGAPPAEAYRTLRTSLHFLLVERAVHRMLLTSAVAGEGKTTTVANLAVTLARAGQRVLMVDADLRKPRLHRFFGLSNDQGLSSALVGEPAAGLVQQVPDVDGLSLLAAGPVLGGAYEKLVSDRAAEVLAELDGLADIILIDAPPVLPVADALVLSQAVDGVLLVASAGKTQPKEARRATELLLSVDAPMLGCVLNAVSRDMGDSYAFEYSYDLDPAPEPTAATALTSDAGPDIT